MRKIFFLAGALAMSACATMTASGPNAVANLEAMIGRIQRNGQVMVDHRALRRLGRCGGAEESAGGCHKGNEHQSRKSRLHGVTSDHEGLIRPRVRGRARRGRASDRCSARKCPSRRCRAPP